MQGKLANIEQARNFVQAGNATVTLRSLKSGSHFTYKVQAPFAKDGTSRDLASDFRFVKVLTGSDNENNYSYLGYIRRGVFFHGGHKARISYDTPSAKAFTWTWKNIASGSLPPVLEVWHEGRCGRCGRKLTVPSSIASGFGPECAERVGFFAEAV
jgi:hypothetical protein